MTTGPHKALSDAMAAFLANPSGENWALVVREVEKQMKDKQGTNNYEIQGKT